MTTLLKMKNVNASINEKSILKDLSLEINPGEIHALMGPNGCGKSTLSYVLAGHPRYDVQSGTVNFNGKNILDLSPAERSKEGIFLAFQYPLEVAGLNLSNFLFSAMKVHNKDLSPLEFNNQLKENLTSLGKDTSFVSRHVNVGFSGGEKKKAEVLQLLMLKPKLAILDETDSGLDVDALQLVSKAIASLKGPDFSALLITHYPKILHYLNPDKVHVMIEGKIVASGGKELIAKIESEGYASWEGKDDAGIAEYSQ